MSQVDDCRDTTALGGTVRHEVLVIADRSTRFAGPQPAGPVPDRADGGHDFITFEVANRAGIRRNSARIDVDRGSIEVTRTWVPAPYPTWW